MYPDDSRVIAERGIVAALDDDDDDDDAFVLLLRLVGPDARRSRMNCGS
ncbi:MAG: hypothetical protein ACREQ3_25225 [Candidatus Binatia bacterium]